MTSPTFHEHSTLSAPHRAALLAGAGASGLLLLRARSLPGRLAAASAVVAGVLASRTSTDVSVSERRLRVELGPWRRSVPLRDVVRAEVVPVDVFRTGGFGVRVTMESVTVHLGQLLGVQVELEGGDVLTVGTHRPTELLMAVRASTPGRWDLNSGAAPRQ